MDKLCKIVLFLVLTCSSFHSYSQCNSLNNLLGSFDVPPGLDTCYEITLERLLNNDLGSNNGLLGVNLDFTHNNVSELLIELYSPNGDLVTLVGDITTGSPTNSSRWSVLFSECSGGAVPDISEGINSENWENSEPWSVFTTYTGIYYPHSGCFEDDFNVGPLNGTWKLRINNTSSFETAMVNEIGFILQDEVCSPCAADVGTQTISSITACTNDDLNLNLGLVGQTLNSDYTLGYFVVNENDEIVNINLDGNFVGILPGNYDVCAFSIDNDELSSLISLSLSYTDLLSGINDGSIPFCIDISSTCTEFRLLDGPEVVVLDRTICQGDITVIGSDVFSLAGSYSATLPAMSGDLCDTSVVLNLSVRNIQPLIESSFPEFNCSNPTITLDASSSIQESGSTWMWSTIDGQIDTDPQDISIEISSPGTYFLTQTEAGCSRETFFTIAQATDVPQVTIVSGQLSCIDESATLRLSSLTTFQSAQWVGPGNFTSSELEPEVSIPGQYQVTLTSSSGCEIRRSYFLNQGGDQPSISASAPNLSCANSSVQITVDNTSYSSYRWTGPSGFVANIAEPMAVISGTYYLEVQDENGCKGYTSVEILGDEGSFEYEILGEDFLCPTGQTTISATSEISTAIYSWTGPNGFFSSSPINEVMEQGTYYIEIIANGCIVRDSVTLGTDISDLPAYEVQVDTLGSCENPQWRLTAIPLANEFQTSRIRWGISGVGIVGEGTQLDVSEVGRYTLFINTFNGCQIIERFEIEPLDAAPEVTLGISNISCLPDEEFGTITVTESADFQYDWQGPGDPLPDTSFLDSLPVGDYFLTVTNINSGCITIYNGSVRDLTAPRNVSLMHTNITCDDSEAVILATVNGGGNSYEWKGPEGILTTKDITVTTPGKYILTVTGGNGCITVDSTVILDDTSPPQFTLDDYFLECTTQSATLDPQTNEPGLTYHWTGPDEFESTAAVPLVFASGEYIVTITGLNGCTAEASFDVMPNPDTPEPIAGSSDTLNCINTEVSITADANIPVLSYSWNGPSSFVSIEQNPLVSIPGEYVLTIESMQGCIGFDTVNVIQEIVLPVVQFAYDDEVDCIAHTASLTGISDDPGAQFTWEGPNNFIQTGENVIATDTGSYIIYVRGSNNCVDSDTFSIGIESISFQTDIISNCFQPALLISELSDSLNYMIEWTLPDGSLSNETALTPTDNGLYNASVIGSNGCLADVMVNVTLDTISPLSAIQQVGQIRCDEDEIELNNNGSSIGSEYEYQWKTINGNILGDNTLPQIGIKGVGNYELEVLNNLNGCRSVALLPVVEAPQEFTEIALTISNPLCHGESNGSITFENGFNGTAPFEYSLDGVIFTSDLTFSGLPAGVYSYIARDSFGCIVEEMVTIGDPEELVLDLGENVDVFLGNEVEIAATTNLSMAQIESIRWQIENQLGCADCLSFTLSPSRDLLIELTLTNENGCSVTDQVKVRVDENPVLYKPNVFSPNEDGVNDQFVIYSNPGVLQFKSIAIFDRWGTKVFENVNFEPGDFTAGWDGKINGQSALPGVYVYKLDVEMITGDVRSVKGDVTIIK